MFGLFKSDSNNPNTISNPINGMCIALESVEDEVFSTGMMGKGIAVIPYEGKVYAPCDGEVTMTFPTGHAVGLQADNGAEILIHIGIDTVKMNGIGFNLNVQPEQKVKRGDLLLQFDIEEIKKAGYPITTPVIITNSDEYPDMSVKSNGEKKVGEPIITLC